MQWGRTNVSPTDWISVLRTQLQLRGVSKSNQECCKWLEQYDVKVNPTDISKLAGISECAVKLSPRHELVLNAIITNVSARSAIIYFESLAYRGLRFFFPRGNPVRSDTSTIPNGVYQATRFSFSEPGRIIKSAFLFYRNDASREILGGYGDSLSVEENSKKSNILRFKELRQIQPKDRPEYQIIVGGFVFYNRGSFILAGAAFEMSPGIVEQEMGMIDINHVQSLWYILDDDGDSSFIRGIKVTSLRHKYDPAAAVVQLVRIPALGVEDWPDIGNKSGIEIGTYDASQIPEDLTYLEPKVSPDFQMMVVDRYS